MELQSLDSAGLARVPPFNNSVNFRCEHAREFFHRCHYAKLLRLGVAVYGGLDDYSKLAERLIAA